MANIYGEYAYENAIRRNIMMNARITRERKWNSDPQNKEITVFLRDKGRGEFLNNMWSSLCEYGCLTEKQKAAVLSIMEKQAENAARFKDAALNTNHIGEVGQKITLDLTVKKVLSFDGAYGGVYINIMTDKSANTVIYKGAKILANEGCDISVTAKIKSHDSRDGVPQTVIERPKVAKED
jgi:hypothetical protein